MYNNLNDKALIAQLNNGAVGILPPDTVYGLVCRAADKAAVERLHKIKARSDKPGTIIAANIDQLVELGIKPRYLKAVEQFWPNPLSVIVPAEPSLAYLYKAAFSLAVRIPKPTALRKLLNQTGPLLTTSANPPGQPPANNIKEAQKYFGDTIDFYVGGGDLRGHVQSTIIRMVDDAIDIVRPGAVNIDESGKIT